MLSVFVLGACYFVFVHTSTRAADKLMTDKIIDEDEDDLDAEITEQGAAAEKDRPHSQ